MSRGMQVSLIAAVADNGVIGLHGDLPWRVRDDMRFFMRTTRGHWVITGRKNFEAMGLLKDRPTVVVSRNEALEAPGAHVVASVHAGLLLAQEAGEQEAFVIGGAGIYAAGYEFAHVFYRTRILASPSGDVSFPALDFSGWAREVLLEGQVSEVNDHAFVVEKLTRPGQPPRSP